MDAGLLTVTVELKRAGTGFDMYGDVIEQPPVSIKCVWQQDVVEIAQKGGKIINSDVLMVTNDEVKTGEIVVYEGKEYKIAHVNKMRGLDGSVDHYEARL